MKELNEFNITKAIQKMLVAAINIWEGPTLLRSMSGISGIGK
jgi:hypothetical protein